MVADIIVHPSLDLRDYVASQSSEIGAGAAIRYLRPMFAWAAEERIIGAHPWTGLKAGATAEARDLLPLIGHIWFASVPGRGAPDHGEICCAHVIERIGVQSYAAPLGTEYKPVAETGETLGWMAQLRG